MDFEYAKQFKTKIESFLKIDINDVVAKPKWGEVNFESSREDLSIFYDLCTQLLLLPIEKIPFGLLQQYSNSFDEVISVVNEAMKFEIGSTDHMHKRNVITDRFTNTLKAFFLHSVQWIPYLGYFNTLDSTLKDDILSRKKEVTDYLGLVKSDIEKKQKEIDSILNASREASASTGVSQFAQEYQLISDSHKNESKKWLTRTVVLASTTFVMAILPILLILFSQVSNVYELIQITTIKVFLLTLSLSATIWCGRMYKTSRNLEEINKHRATALKTFQTFVQATKNDVIRDAVLIETTRSIFAHTPTGYVDGDNHSTDVGTKYFELIKSTIPSTQGH